MNTQNFRADCRIFRTEDGPYFGFPVAFVCWLHEVDDMDEDEFKDFVKGVVRDMSVRAAGHDEYAFRSWNPADPMDGDE